MISLATALRGIVQLQAMTRGFLSRRIHFGRVRLVDRRHIASAPAHSYEISRKVSAGSGEIDLGDSSLTEAATEAARGEEEPSDSVDARIVSTEGTNSQNVVTGEGSLSVAIWHEIGLEIRECWWQAQSADPHPVQARKDRLSVLGCEVEGELVLQDDHDESPTEVSFALWWDASHAQLNSRFEHSFRSRRRGRTTALASEVSEVNLRFHVQTDFLRLSGADTHQGQAVLSLRDMLKQVATSKNGCRAADRRDSLMHCEKDFDVPIEWQNDSPSHLARVFPIRVSYRVVSRSSAVSRSFEPAVSAASSFTLDDSELKSSHIATLFPDLLGEHIGESVKPITAIAADEDDFVECEKLPDPKAETLQMLGDDDSERHNGGSLLVPDERSTSELGDNGLAPHPPADTFWSDIDRPSSASSNSEETPALQHDVLDQDGRNPDRDELSHCQEAGDHGSVTELVANDADIALDRSVGVCEATTEHETKTSAAGFEEAGEPADHAEPSRSTDSRLEIEDLSFVPPDEITDFYPPITLSSFGIEEIQLSPSGGSASSQVLMAEHNDRSPVERDDYDSSTISQLEEHGSDHGSHEEMLLQAESSSEGSYDETQGFPTRDDEPQVDSNALASEPEVSNIPDGDPEGSEPEPSISSRVSATQDARVQTDSIEVGPLVVIVETRRLMVDAACGISDDDGSNDGDVVVGQIAEDACENDPAKEESGSDAETNVSLQAVDEREGVQEPAHPSLKDDVSASSSPFAPAAVEGGEATTSPSSEDEKPSSNSLTVPPQQTEPSLSLPVDKFELICRLLIDIRDSCGAERVREIIAAHTAHVAQLERNAEKSAVDTTDMKRRRGKDDEFVNEHEVVVSAADDDYQVQTQPQQQLSVPPDPTRRESVEQSGTTSSQADVEYGDMLHSTNCYCTANQQHRPVPTSPEAPKREHLVYSSTASSAADAEDVERQYRDTTVATESASPHRSRVLNLKPLHWSDSHTLQQEMRRRLERSDSHLAASSSRVSVAATSLTREESLSRSRYDSKLFADAVASPAFAFRSRPPRKLLSYKADSETERIARIMQGSVNYWRKGDEHAIASDEDSADSDSDDDLYF